MKNMPAGIIHMNFLVNDFDEQYLKDNKIDFSVVKIR